MKPSELKKLIGQKVLVTHRGLVLTGNLTGLDPRFNFRDALVHLPYEKKPRRFYASKISKI